MEEVKLAIKPYYQKKDITKEEYKDILRKAVHKVGPRTVGLGPGSRRGHRVGPIIESRPRCPGAGRPSAVPRSADLPQQERGDQPCQGEQPGEGLRPALPLLPQAWPQAGGPPRTPSATQGAGAPR